MDGQVPQQKMLLWMETEPPPLLGGRLEEHELLGALLAPQGHCACTQAADALPAPVLDVCRWVQTDSHFSKEMSLGCRIVYLFLDPVLALWGQAPNQHLPPSAEPGRWC